MNASAGDFITVTWTVGNVGEGAPHVFSWNDTVYLSELFYPERYGGTYFRTRSGDPVTGLPVWSLYGGTKRPTAAMLRIVSWILSSIRMAPWMPSSVLVKNSSKPLVVACVTMKRPTPRIVHDKLMNMARFFAVRKRKAMRRFGDITTGRTRPLS